jgi:hypothetical protein
MPLPQFSDLRGDDRLTEFQRTFLDRLGDLLTTEKPSLVPLESVTAGIKMEGKAKAHIEVTIPNQGDPDVSLLVTVEPQAVVVSYGWYDHIHFGYGEPEPPVEEAFGFIRDMLLGNVEVEITYGWFWTNVTTHRFDRSTGARERMGSGSTPAIFAGGFRWPPRPSEVRRISFTYGRSAR